MKREQSIYIVPDMSAPASELDFVVPKAGRLVSATGLVVFDTTAEYNYLSLELRRAGVGCFAQTATQETKWAADSEFSFLPNGVKGDVGSLLDSWDETALPVVTTAYVAHQVALSGPSPSCVELQVGDVVRFTTVYTDLTITKLRLVFEYD